jgi:RHS repeat-associated protein
VAGSDAYATILYQHGDHLTTRLTTDNNGDYSNEQRHYPPVVSPPRRVEPYGEQIPADDCGTVLRLRSGQADASVLRKFTTYLKEEETDSTGGKLNYAVFRSHSARTGRFLMADPVRGNVKNPQRLNRYSYVGGNPINRRDPNGRDWIYIMEGDGSGLAAGVESSMTSSSGTVHNFYALGGTVGATNAWHQSQKDALGWLWTGEVGCWDASGFRDPHCAAIQDSGGQTPTFPNAGSSISLTWGWGSIGGLIGCGGTLAGCLAAVSATPTTGCGEFAAKAAGLCAARCAASFVAHRNWIKFGECLYEECGVFTIIAAEGCAAKDNLRRAKCVAEFIGCVNRYL